MGIFTGRYEKTIDAKNRIQLPSRMRQSIDPGDDGELLYVTLGDFERTLWLFTKRDFEELAQRIQTEVMSDPEARQFELQFYSMTEAVELDKQGRLVLPEALLKWSELERDVFVIGQKSRMEIWNRSDYLERLGLGEGEPGAKKIWPKWQGFVRMKAGPGGAG